MKAGSGRRWRDSGRGPGRDCLGGGLIGGNAERTASARRARSGHPWPPGPLPRTWRQQLGWCESGWRRRRRTGRAPWARPLPGWMGRREVGSISASGSSGGGACGDAGGRRAVWAAVRGAPRRLPRRPGSEPEQPGLRSQRPRPLRGSSHRQPRSCRASGPPLPPLPGRLRGVDGDLSGTTPTSPPRPPTHPTRPSSARSKRSSVPSGRPPRIDPPARGRCGCRRGALRAAHRAVPHP